MNSACVESDSGSSCCVQVSTEVGEYGKGGHIVGDDSQLESVLKKSSREHKIFFLDQVHFYVRLYKKAQTHERYS